MPDTFVKICVYTDFEFLSTNHHYCIYPDKYAFTIPTILLTEHLALTGIFTGDVFATFTADETRPFSMTNFYKMRDYYRSVGLDFDSPVKGVSEIGTEMINRYYGNADIANTCQYGGFKKPCMKCIKCFRKTLIKNHLSNTEPAPAVLKNFEQAPAVRSFYHKDDMNMHLPLTFKEILSKLDTTEYPTINGIKQNAQLHDKDAPLPLLYVPPYQTNNNSRTMQYCINKLAVIFK